MVEAVMGGYGVVNRRCGLSTAEGRVGGGDRQDARG